MQPGASNKYLSADIFSLGLFARLVQHLGMLQDMEPISGQQRGDLEVLSRQKMEPPASTIHPQDTPRRQRHQEDPFGLEVCGSGNQSLITLHIKNHPTDQMSAGTASILVWIC